MRPNVIWMDAEGIECGRTNSLGMFFPTEPGHEGKVDEGFMMHGVLPFLDWKHEVKEHGVAEAAHILISYVQYVKENVRDEAGSTMSL